MKELKTKPTEKDAFDFLSKLSDDRQKNDSFTLLELMRELTHEDPVMWGDSLIGFGRYQYKYKSGREGDWFLTGFAPGKQNISIHIISYLDNYSELLMTLGKHKCGKSCIYVKQLADINLDVLKKIIGKSIDKLSNNSSS